MALEQKICSQEPRPSDSHNVHKIFVNVLRAASVFIVIVDWVVDVVFEVSMSAVIDDKVVDAVVKVSMSAVIDDKVVDAVVKEPVVIAAVDA